jgi:hypothetical protein
MGYWLDHKGGLLGPAPVENPTGWGRYDRQTHRIMRPQPGQLVQAISWCGHRVHEVPGHGDIDCAACLALIAEDQLSREYRHAVQNPAVSAGAPASGEGVT